MLVVPFSGVAGINRKGSDNIDTCFKFHYMVIYSNESGDRPGQTWGLLRMETGDTCSGIRKGYIPGWRRIYI